MDATYNIYIYLLRLINPSLVHVYCSITLSNLGLCSLKNSSRTTSSIYTISYFLFIFNTPYMCANM